MIYMKNKIKVQTMILSALFTALIAVGAFIRIPIPFMNYITLQFFFVTMAGMMLGARAGAISVAVYVALGLMGLPVFADGGGFGYIFRPSFGFLVGFIVAALLCGIISEKSKLSAYKRYALAAFTGIISCYVIGISYQYLILNYYINTPKPIGALILANVPLYMPKDFVLSAVAVIVCKKIEPVVNALKRQKSKHDI